MIYLFIAVYATGLVTGVAGGYLVFCNNKMGPEDYWWADYIKRFPNGTLYGSPFGQLLDRSRSPKSTSDAAKVRLDPSQFNSYMRKKRESDSDAKQ